MTFFGFLAAGVFVLPRSPLR